MYTHRLLIRGIRIGEEIIAEISGGNLQGKFQLGLNYRFITLDMYGPLCLIYESKDIWSCQRTVFSHVDFASTFIILIRH